MAKTTAINWPRISAEAVAIVGSILLAFAIDAWWEERQLRAEEQEILRGLKSEFEAIHATLARDKASHVKRLGYFEALLIAMEDGSAASKPDLLDATVHGMLSPATSDLGSGALDALLSSGRVQILSNRSLRARLASWDGVIAEVWDDQADNAKLVYEVFVPYLIAESVGGGAMMSLWYDDWPYEARLISENPDTVSKLLGDPRFREMIEIRYGYKRHLTDEFDTALEEAEAIIEEIEESIQ